MQDPRALALAPPQPRKLQDLPPKAHLPPDQRRLMRVDQRPFPYQVRLQRLHEARALQHLPEAVRERREQQEGVVGEEGGVVPGREHEAGVAEGEQDDAQPGRGDVRHVRLAPPFVRQGVAVDALRF